ncbi:MAG: 4-hydroxybenzoate octaprenyltransferase [Gammaproteobacteria bacterium]|nr:MAG: 4-hydroxybenzoate octaprenyltransferase [Gammaproteobacteria bacterium]
MDASKIKLYLKLMRLHRPIGILLLLWPTLWALWLSSQGHPDTRVLIIFVLGVVIMRSAGCVINDYLDRDIDPYVKRTLDRPLATGAVSPNEALILFAILIGMAVILVAFLDWKTIALAAVGLVLAVIYPRMKRLIYLPQGFLGLAFGWGIPMAYMAQTGTVPRLAWLLYVATIFWVIAYDSIYAIPDKEDDVRIGIKSSVILFDDLDTTIIMALQLAFLATMVMLGKQLEMGLYYYMGLVLSALLFAYQHYLIRDRSAENCQKAFVNNHWVGTIIFVGIYLQSMIGQA